MTARQMHLVAYLKTGPTALHVGGWRHPEATLDDILDHSRYTHIARVLEAAKFDGCFFADLFGLYDVHQGSFDPYVRGGGQISYLDPTVVLPVMASVTTRLGLGATLSTSFHTPYHLARWLGSLDAMSKGRVAWNVVTSATDLEARNAGMDALPPRELRYDRADEVLEACFALWNSWDPDALVRDKKSGIMSDPSKVHYANYEGRWIKTRGPLSIPRSPQGHPVIMQAGSSDRGRAFGARWAEMIFTAQRGREEMGAFYADIKSRMQAFGRAPQECAILPSVSVVLGETLSIARERADYLNSLIDPALVLASASSGLGADLSKLDTAKSLAELQGNQGMKGTQDVLEQRMKAEGITLQQAAATRGKGREIVGTASMIADHLQSLFEAGVCDGFVLTPSMFPGMFEEFCRSVVPELQSRGVFRTEYTGQTLREHIQN
jgi:FMN-dependent oxidoreductase (nitrilotriacetate monooxygenase family)